MPAIIILDDEPEVLSVMGRLLNQQGWDMFPVANPDDALAMVQQRAPDVVITDIRMPGMSGIDVLHKVKLVDPFIEVILITGHASIESAIEGLNEGAFAYLRKPFESLSLVVSTVARALDKRRAEVRNRELLRSLEQAMAEIETTNRELLSAHMEFLTLAKLVDVGRQLITLPDPASMLRFTANRAREIMNAEACVIWLRKEDDHTLSVQATAGIPETVAGAANFLDNAPVAMRATEQGLPFCIDDLRTKDALDLPAEWQSLGFRSLLAAPLLLHKEPQGALVVYAAEAAAYGERDAQVFTLLTSQISAALESTALYQNLEQQYLGTVSALASAVEARDPYTSGHSRRVARYSVAIAKHLGLSESELALLHKGGLLHDIGKIGIPDQILLKPGPLTNEEWVTMRQHPVIGTEILHNVPRSDKIRTMVLHHHERMDGTGYPDGLQGDEIPFFVRILAVADGFEAMTAKRAYREAMSIGKALTTLREGAGSQWDREVVKALHSYLRWRERDQARQLDRLSIGISQNDFVSQAQMQVYAPTLV